MCDGKCKEQNKDGVGDVDENNGGLAAPDGRSGINRFMEEVESGNLRRGTHLRSHNPGNMPSSKLFLARLQFLRLPSVPSALGLIFHRNQSILKNMHPFSMMYELNRVEV